MSCLGGGGGCGGYRCFLERRLVEVDGAVVLVGGDQGLADPGPEQSVTGVEPVGRLEGCHGELRVEDLEVGLAQHRLVLGRGPVQLHQLLEATRVALLVSQIRQENVRLDALSSHEDRAVLFDLVQHAHRRVYKAVSIHDMTRGAGSGSTI